MSFAVSIFDDDDEFVLWKKFKGDFDLNKETVIFTAPMLKKSKKPTEYTKKYFYITQNYLYYKDSQNDKNIRGWTKLDWMRVVFSADTIDENESSEQSKERVGGSYFCIRLIRNCKYCQLYAEDKDTFLKFTDALRKLTVQADFHKMYSISHLINQGSFAEVVAAKHLSSKKIYAVKVFNKDKLFESEREILSLINEVAILRKLDGDLVNKFYEIHETEKNIFLVLEYQKGGPILNVENVKKYGLPATTHCIKSILNTLVYLNQMNIMHRDLKPDNIMFADKDPNLESSPIKLIDFGLSAFTGQDEYVYKRCGTPGFVAPEVLKTKSTDFQTYTTKCDVYSVGITMYYMLSGKLPFNHQDYKEVIKYNREGRVNFDIANLHEFKGTNAMDLMKLMLTNDANERPTAYECLEHVFFKKCVDSQESTANTKQSGNKRLERDSMDKGSDFSLKPLRGKSLNYRKTEIVGSYRKVNDNSILESGVLHSSIFKEDTDSNGQIEVPKKMQTPRSKNFRIIHKSSATEIKLFIPENRSQKTPLLNRRIKTKEEYLSNNKDLLNKTQHIKIHQSLNKSPQSFNKTQQSFNKTQQSFKIDQLSKSSSIMNSPLHQQMKSKFSNQQPERYSGIISKDKRLHSNRIKKELVQVNGGFNNNIKLIVRGVSDSVDLRAAPKSSCQIKADKQASESYVKNLISNLDESKCPKKLCLDLNKPSLNNNIADLRKEAQFFKKGGKNTRKFKIEINSPVKSKQVC